MKYSSAYYTSLLSLVSLAAMPYKVLHTYVAYSYDVLRMYILCDCLCENYNHVVASRHMQLKRILA